MMITQTFATAPAVISWADAVTEAYRDHYNGIGISDSAARTIAVAYMSPSPLAWNLCAFGQGTPFDTDGLRTEVQREYDFANGHPQTEEEDLVALSSLLGWIDEKERSSE